MQRHSHQRGYSLIEVLIAISILMVAIVAPMTIAIKSIQSSVYALEQNTATFLAQEAISVIEGLRNHRALFVLYGIDGNPWTFFGQFDSCRESVSPGGCNFDVTTPYQLLNGAYTAAQVVSCDPVENCRLYYNETWGTSKYRVQIDEDGDGTVESGEHGFDGEPSPFIRQIFLTDVPNISTEVRVVVSWDANFLGQEQQVTMYSDIFNIYGDF